MNHQTDDQLLLLAYGELAEPQVTAIESHLAACPECANQLSRLERARVALDIALPRRRPAIAAWATLGALVAAAAVAGVLLTRIPPSPAVAAHGWNPTKVWSATAGYVAGGNAVVDIDAQLTRLEQERSYALPN